MANLSDPSKNSDNSFKEPEAAPRLRVDDAANIDRDGGDAPVPSARAVLSGYDNSHAPVAGASKLPPGPSAIQMPTAPPMPKLPYGILTIISLCLIVVCAPFVEVPRAQVVAAMVDMQGPSGPTFVDMHVNLANVLQRRGLASQAELGLNQALAKLQAMPVPRRDNEVRILLKIAALQINDKRIDEGKKTTERALDLLAKSNLDFVPMPLVWQLDQLAQMLPIEDESSPNIDLTIKLWRTAAKYWTGGNKVELSNYYWRIAGVQATAQRYKDGGYSYLDALDLTEVRGNVPWRAAGYRLAAYCFNNAKLWDRGRSAAQKGYDMWQLLSDGREKQGEVAYCLYFLGQAEGEMGRYEKSVGHLQQALPDLKAMYPNDSCYPWAMWFLANSYRDSDHLALARKFYDQCFDETKKTGVGPDMDEVQKDMMKLNLKEQIEKTKR